MENLHLKNLNPSNIKHTKETIKYTLSTIDIRDYKINKFKQEYLDDLYNPLNNTKHLVSIGQEMIDIFNVLKDLQQNKPINDEILIKLEQINNDRINIHKTIYYGKNLTECLINYSTKKDPWFDTDYNEIGIYIGHNNKIQTIHKIK